MSKELREKLLKLIAEEGVLEEFDKPVFFLKSGYRTFYFFNVDRLTHNPKIVPFLEKALIHQIEKLRAEAEADGKNITKLVLFEKSYGETAGTEPLVSSIAYQTDLEAVTLPSPILYPYVDRVKGMPVRKGEHSLVIDDIVTTGRGLLSNIERFERITQSEVYASIPIVHRQIGVLSTKRKIVPLYTKEDLIKVGLLKPEILKLSFDSIYWPGIDMNCDYLQEIYMFAGEPDRHTKLFEKMKALFRLHLRGLPVSKPEIARYLVNIQMLIWNYVRTVLLDQPVLKREEVVECIEDFLSIEFLESLTVDIYSRAISKAILPTSSIDLETLHSLFVQRQKEIVNEISNKLLRMKKHRAERRISKGTAENLVKAIVRKTHKTTELLADKYNIDQSKFEESDKAMREGLWEVLKKHYKITN